MLGNQSSFRKTEALAAIALILASAAVAGQRFLLIPASAAACENLDITGVSAIGYEGRNRPDNVIDDRLTTRWSHFGSGSWITLDLGEQKTVCSGDVAWYKGFGRTNEFSIALSADGGSFDTVYSGESGGRTLSFEKYSFAETPARYVRVTFDDSSDGQWASITEIDVYGYTQVSDEPPEVRITSPADGSVVSDTGSITVQGTASDDSRIEIVEVRVDDGDYVQATPGSPGDWSTWSAELPVASGERRIVARATDNAGNQAWNSIYVTVVAESDTTAPSVSISSPAAGATVPAGAVAIEGTASDGESGVSKVEVRIDGGQYIAATPRAADDWSTWSASLDAAAGDHTFYAMAADKTGNSRERSVDITADGGNTIDTTSPSVQILDPAENSDVTVADGAITITGAASDGQSGIGIVEVRVDGESYVAATPESPGDWSEWSVTLPITAGERRLVPRATDNAGNHAWNSIYVTVTERAEEDTFAPAVEITDPADGSTVSVADGRIAVQGTASDAGSGVREVEVRVDDGSYVAATPESPGDWSTWSAELPVASGERRIVARVTDNAENQMWNSAYVTVTAGGSSPPPSGGDGALDAFGIEKIYQTKQGGNEWYVDMNDPDSDPLFRNLPAMTRQSDGSWQVDGGSRGQVRLEAWSPSNEKWLNIEITEYAKIVGGTNHLLQMYSRGGHHTSSNECLGSAYKARLYGDGEARWVKEVAHPAYTNNRGSMQATNDPLEDRWVGFKAVIYNFVENGKTYVRMESYIDDDVTDSRGNLVIGNNWELASVVEDRGGWSTNDSDFQSDCSVLNKDSDEQYRQRDEILNTGGGTSTQNIAAWRSDDLTWNWKFLTVREIVPPS